MAGKPRQTTYTLVWHDVDRYANPDGDEVVHWAAIRDALESAIQDKFNEANGVNSVYDVEFYEGY